MQWSYFRKKASIAFFLFLTSCSSSSHWALNHNKTGVADFDSSKLTYFCTDKGNGLDLEMLRTKTSLHFYLNVHSQSIPPYMGNPKEALVVLFINNKKYSTIGAMHEGGQRVLLPETLQEIIISALKENQPVTIKLQGYSTIIEPENFLKNFEKMQAPSSFSSPFHLPI